MNGLTFVQFVKRRENNMAQLESSEIIKVLEQMIDDLNSPGLLQKILEDVGTPADGLKMAIKIINKMDEEEK